MPIPRPETLDGKLPASQFPQNKTFELLYKSLYNAHNSQFVIYGKSLNRTVALNKVPYEKKYPGCR